MFENIQIDLYLESLITKLGNNIFVWSNLIELIIITFFLILAYFINKLIFKQVRELLSKIDFLDERKQFRIIDQLLYPLILMFLIGVYYIIAASFAIPAVIISIFGNLVSAWLLVKALSLFFPRNKMFRFYQL